MTHAYYTNPIPMDQPMIQFHNQLHRDIFKELGDLIQSKSSTYVCGGSVAIAAKSTETNQPSSPPVIIRWDSANVATGITKLTFPVGTADDSSKTGLIKLIQDCQPASFGYNGENILDETYRKAVKMDRAAFSTDLCPYELGIVDTIAQVLLPNAGGAATKGVRAELYKLNVYSAPSGFFKAHVDTPRSETQFGSLVVSLPCPHEGGQLIVRHANHETTYDWSTSAAVKGTEKDIKWAAFYSDCEHEVAEVTNGHRVTLTYNLYYAPGVGDLAGNSFVMDVRSLPLYGKMQEALADWEFMHKGGFLGVFLAHAYAHATPEGADSIPGVLKGSDMAVYEVFQALNLKPSVHPVLIQPDEHTFSEYDDMFDHSYGSDDLDGEVAFMHDKLRGILVSDAGGDEAESNFLDVVDAWGGHRIKIRWLTENRWPARAVVHMTYGNEAGIDYMYTYAAIRVFVPPASERSGKYE